MMSPFQLRKFTQLVEFLSLTLGPDYEIVLYDMKQDTPCVVAIANGHITGRTVGAQMTKAARDMLAQKSYEKENWKLNYQGVSANGHLLRCSSMFLKDKDGSLIGLLCINFDDSRYRALSSKVYSLCHPDQYINAEPSFFSYTDLHVMDLEDRVESPILKGPELTSSFSAASAEPAPSKEPETSGETSGSLDAILDGVLHQDLAASPVAEKMTQKKKLDLTRTLEQKGFFLLKGAVPKAAEALHCSQATMYRYLTQIKKEKE